MINSFQITPKELIEWNFFNLIREGEVQETSRLVINGHSVDKRELY